jgi:hypothetical protein
MFARAGRGTRLSLAFAPAVAYTPLIRTIDLLVDRAEPALLPKTSLKSDLSPCEGRAGLTAQLRILEKLNDDRNS